MELEVSVGRCCMCWVDSDGVLHSRLVVVGAGLGGLVYRECDETGKPLADSADAPVNAAVGSGATFVALGAAPQRAPIQLQRRPTLDSALGLYMAEGDEVIRWQPADEPLDDSMIVLVKMQAEEAGEPVWFGYREDGQWFYPHGSKIDVPVTAWAELPVGPPFDASSRACLLPINRQSIVDGLYRLDYTHGSLRHSRKVLVEGGFYRFADERGVPLSGAVPLRVDIAMNSDAKAVFTPVAVMEGVAHG